MISAGEAQEPDEGEEQRERQNSILLDHEILLYNPIISYSKYSIFSGYFTSLHELQNSETRVRFDNNLFSLFYAPTCRRTMTSFTKHWQ